MNGVGGSNGPAIVNGDADSYERNVAMDAPVAMDSGLYVYPTKSLAQLRTDLMTMLGFAGMAANPPPGMAATLNLHLQLAQSEQYWRYPTLRTERWWPWQVAAGQRFYDTPIDGVSALNFRRITAAWIADNGGVPILTWASGTVFALGALVRPLAASTLVYQVTVAGTTAGVEPAWPTALGGTVVNGTVTFKAVDRPDARWTPLRAGINPADFSTSQLAMPRFYEVREYLELWPSPDKPYVVWLKGHLGLARFEQDDDLCTIDHEVVLLFATASAKAHYRQPDANIYAQRASALAHQLTAAAHGTRRYIPRPSTAGMKFDDGTCALTAVPRTTFERG